MANNENAAPITAAEAHSIALEIKRKEFLAIAYKKIREEAKKGEFQCEFPAVYELIIDDLEAAGFTVIGCEAKIKVKWSGGERPKTVD